MGSAIVGFALLVRMILRGRKLLSHHFLRLTRVHRWTDEIDKPLLLDVVEIVAHGDAMQSIAGALCILLQQEVIPHERAGTCMPLNLCRLILDPSNVCVSCL